MDFIARAGSMMAKAHLTIGVLLVMVLVEGVLLVNLMGRNAELQESYQHIRDEMKVYVVPGAAADTYSPTKSEMLLQSFMTHITQSLNTYTYANFEAQYLEMSRFLLPETMEVMKKTFKDRIEKARELEQSSLFVPDNRTFRFSTQYHQGLGRTITRATLTGKVQDILGGSVIEARPMKFTLYLDKANISLTNPFGYRIVKYEEELLGDK